MKLKDITEKFSSAQTRAGLILRAPFHSARYSLFGGDFQMEVMKPLMEYIVKRTSKGLTFSGFENLSKEEQYIFVSNHVLIIDSAFFNLAMHYNGFPTTYSVIGDNLMRNKYAANVFNMNKCMTLKRGACGFQAGKAAAEISMEIAAKLASKESVWIAQSRGRDKEGIYATDTTITKMLLLGNRKHNFVPVAVSYELDPDDFYKARASEKHFKKHGSDDIKCIVDELFKYKGGIHISIGTPFKGTESPEDTKEMIDRQIALNYRIWPTNEAAFHAIEADNPAFLKGTLLEDRLQGLSPELKQRIMQFYAQPVLNLRSYTAI